MVKHFSLTLILNYSALVFAQTAFDGYSEISVALALLSMDPSHEVACWYVEGSPDDRL